VLALAGKEMAGTGGGAGGIMLNLTWAECAGTGAKHKKKRFFQGLGGGEEKNGGI
jgi:hypothetical protein